MGLSCVLGTTQTTSDTLSRGFSQQPVSAYEYKYVTSPFTDVRPGAQRYELTFHPAGSGGAQAAAQAASLKHRLPIGNGV